MAAPQEQIEGASVTSTNRDGAAPIQLPNTYTQQPTTLNQPFSLKLDRNNFTLWKTMVSTIVRGHRLHGYLLGTRMCPPEFIPVAGEAKYEGELETNPDYEQGIINDQLLMGWLYSSMTEGIATEVMGSSTAAGLWRSLESLYGAYSKSKMDETRTLIQTVRKGSTPMTEYLRQKKNWSDILALAGDPYPEAHLVANVLSGLDAEYLSIVVQIEARPTTTWQELQDILLSFDSKIERLQTLSISSKPATSSTPQANLAAKNNPGNNSTGRGRGSQNSNHYTSSGGRFSGNRGSPGRFRGRGRTNTSRPTCQVCGKYGHSAAICYNRFDESYMGSDPNNTNGGNKTAQNNHNAFIASPEVLESDAWFVDSGASNHITSDAAAMNQKQPYGGQGNSEGGAPRNA